jgi:hypothetical protein
MARRIVAVGIPKVRVGICRYHGFPKIWDRDGLCWFLTRRIAHQILRGRTGDQRAMKNVGRKDFNKAEDKGCKVIRSNIPTGPVQPAMPTLSASQELKENGKGLWEMIIISKMLVVLRCNHWRSNYRNSIL